ncbi:MAG: glutathione peroxidase [Bacteriovorax sp.]|nr:glutathione peroxidase [Bacteriovorax sp.]
MENLNQINFNLNNGKTTNLSAYSGKVLLLVNVASQCGLTPQYEGLEKIYSKYKDNGFEVIGFPANEFGAQEPGTNAEIQEFCQLNYGVKFPVVEKIVVKGEGIHLLYKTLTAAKPAAVQADNSGLAANLEKHGLLSGGPSEIMWNFEKFLVKDGVVIERFAPDISPEDPKLTQAIESALKGK